MIQRAAYVVGVLLIVSGLIHLGILVVTGGPWSGPVSLRKPMTFGISFGLTVITIVWVSSFLRLGDRAKALLLFAFTVASVLETALISLQAWRGVPSHFNIETTFDAAVGRTLAAGGIVLIAVITALTITAFRSNPSVTSSLAIAIRVGFVALVGAVVVGGLMIARGMALVSAGDPQAAYTTGGILKPVHAVALHGILVLPALAWLLSFTNWNERRCSRLVLVVSIGYATLAAVIAIIALD